MNFDFRSGSMVEHRSSSVMQSHLALSQLWEATTNSTITAISTYTVYSWTASNRLQDVDFPCSYPTYLVFTCTDRYFYGGSMIMTLECPNE